ncbi:MAG TPA: chromate transporter [Stellaceae bacterium]|nr:chromate transporter [Stellaceae bacterium]
MKGSSQLGALAVSFLTISLLAFGGANAVIPEMHRQAVDVARWMTDRQFVSLYALAQAAPGPNVMVVTLIGWHVAGLEGALVATAAMMVPSVTLTFLAYRLWSRFRHRPWLETIQNGLTPVTVGLVASSAFLLAKTSDHGMLAYLLTAATAALTYWTGLNPLWVFGVAACLGGFGLLG